MSEDSVVGQFEFPVRCYGQGHGGFGQGQGCEVHLICGPPSDPTAGAHRQSLHPSYDGHSVLLSGGQYSVPPSSIAHTHAVVASGGDVSWFASGSAVPMSTVASATADTASPPHARSRTQTIGTNRAGTRKRSTRLVTQKRPRASSTPTRRGRGWARARSARRSPTRDRIAPPPWPACSGSSGARGRSCSA